MTKEEFVKRIASKTGFTQKDCVLFVDAFCEAVSDALKNGERVKLLNFGVFEVKERNVRTGRNFCSNESCPIPKRKLPSFTPGVGLKKAVGGGLDARD